MRMSLFKELKRRNVFRVAAAYVVIGWLLLQIATTLTPALHLPKWIVSAIALFLILGFIPAMLFSWAYELTPEGLKKDKDVDKSNSNTPQTAKKLDVITLVAVVGIAGLIGWQQMNSPTPNSVFPAKAGIQNSESTVLDPRLRGEDGSNVGNEKITGKAISKEQSIAVLPFVNMSSDAEQEYFADGISEEILNVLVRIPKLKVAGRTSSFSFKGKNQDLRKIGEALGVNHILEGSVRRSGTRLRITAQLIRSEDGFHLWSDTYDREFEDIFDIQDEISQQVAEQLAITLGLNTKIKAHERTKDLVAYENYLKAKQLFLLRGKDNLDKALVLLNESTTRDPDFAPAYTFIAMVYGVYEAYSSEEEVLANSKTWRATGKQAAQHALELDPDSGVAHAAQGIFYFYDFELIKSFENFDRALVLEPDNPIVLDTVVQQLGAVGYFNEGQKLSAKSVSIDPLVAMYRNVQGYIQGYMGNREEAITSLKKSIELDTSLPFPNFNLFMVYSSNPKYFSELESLIKQAISNKVFNENMTNQFTEFLKILDNEKLLADKKALRELAKKSDSRILIEFVSQYNADPELLINKRFVPQWSTNYDYGPDLFTFPPIEGFYKNKRLKEQVKKDGVLGLWQSRGFPAHCKALGEDDFECE